MEAIRVESKRTIETEGKVERKQPLPKESVLLYFFENFNGNFQSDSADRGGGSFRASVFFLGINESLTKFRKPSQSLHYKEKWLAQSKWKVTPPSTANPWFGSAEGGGK